MMWENKILKTGEVIASLWSFQLFKVAIIMEMTAALEDLQKQ